MASANMAGRISPFRFGTALLYGTYDGNASIATICTPWLRL
jgi:hypothetical protein